MQKNDNLHNNNNGNGANSGTPADEVLHIGERVFRKAKLGLAEEEVRSYVDELISQRNALIKRQEHLAGLTELAEKTIIEANNLSQLMMKKSTEQAKAEADKILVKAEQDSEQMFKAIKVEAKTAGEKEAAASACGMGPARAGIAALFFLKVLRSLTWVFSLAGICACSRFFGSHFGNPHTIEA